MFHSDQIGVKPMEPKTKRAILKACKWVFWGVTGPVLAFCLFMFFALTFVGVENICWWYPLIETHFTPDYSDEKFARIQPGSASTRCGR